MSGRDEGDDGWRRIVFVRKDKMYIDSSLVTFIINPLLLLIIKFFF